MSPSRCSRSPGRRCSTRTPPRRSTTSWPRERPAGCSSPPTTSKPPTRSSRARASTSCRSRRSSPTAWTWPSATRSATRSGSPRSAPNRLRPMANRTSYPPGTFSWAELVTSDADAAKSFYTAAFGWEYRDNPVGEGMVYSTALLGGQPVAALYRGDQPPHWNCYVTVESADDAAARAAALGASTLAEPFDVLDVGRMAVIADPAGAALCLWEPRGHIGAAVVNAPGALTWNDLITPDVEAAARFYGDLFGWTTLEIPGGGGYRVIHNGGGPPRGGVGRGGGVAPRRPP